MPTAHIFHSSYLWWIILFCLLHCPVKNLRFPQEIMTFYKATLVYLEEYLFSLPPVSESPGYI